VGGYSPIAAAMCSGFPKDWGANLGYRVAKLTVFFDPVLSSLSQSAFRGSTIPRGLVSKLSQCSRQRGVHQCLENVQRLWIGGSGGDRIFRRRPPPPCSPSSQTHCLTYTSVLSYETERALGDDMNRVALRTSSPERCFMICRWISGPRSIVSPEPIFYRHSRTRGRLVYLVTAVQSPAELDTSN